MVVGPIIHRSGSSDVKWKTSPSTPKSTRKSKQAGSVSDSGTSVHTSSTSTTSGSPRLVHSNSPRSPVLEKKSSGKVVQLESQIAQLQEDLQKTKDQLISSELSRKQAQEEAEETKKYASIMAAKAEETQSQLLEFSATEEVCLQDLRMISQEWDKAWQFELEAVQNQHSADAGSLEVAMDELQKLKTQLDSVVKLKAALAEESNAAQAELQKLRLELEEKSCIVDKLEFQLRNGAQEQAEKKDMLTDTLKELEQTQNSTVTLELDKLKLKESLSFDALELEKSIARISSMEENFMSTQKNQLGVDDSFDKGVEGFGCGLEEFECKYWEDETVSMLKLQSAFELVNDMKSGFQMREAELESEVKDRKIEVDELKANLTEKEAQLLNLLDMNKDLNAELERNRKIQMESDLCLAELKLDIINKEEALKSIKEENELLKSEMGKKEIENRKAYEDALAEVELARSGAQEATLRLGYATEEADKSSTRASRSAEQVDALQTKKLEMEDELRKLRIQSDQWRKAAEAAAAILTANDNGRLVDRTGSLDSEYYSVRKLMSSPYSDDLIDDDSPKRKSSSMLKKIGGFWKMKQK